MNQIQTPQSRVEVSFSVAKLFSGLLLLAVAFGIAMFMLFGDSVGTHKNSNGIANQIIPILGGGVIIAYAGLLIRTLMRGRIAFVLDSKGIEIKNLNPLPATFVAWDDITELRLSENRGHKIIVMRLEDERGFMSKQTSALQLKFLERSQQQYLSPFVIETAFLATKGIDVFQLVRERYENHIAQTQS